MEGVTKEQARRAGLDASDPRLNQTLALAKELLEFPRHLSQHVGGFVISETRLDEIVPIENAAMEDRTVIEWDKDDLDTLEHTQGRCSRPRHVVVSAPRARSDREDIMEMKHTLASIPEEDQAVYDMLSRADSIGVFQVESRAQMSMLPRLRPEKFYDLVIEVAIVRPGPDPGRHGPSLSATEGRP